MKKTALFATLIITAFSLGVMAQATVSLLPDIQVSVTTKTLAVVSCCAATGYREYDGGALVDPAIVFDANGDLVSYAWTNDAAMLAHYRARIIDGLKRWQYQAWEAAQIKTPPDGGFE